MPNILRPCLAAGLLLLAPACHAQLYKWVDAQGRVHYSDNKEEAGKAQVKELTALPPPGGSVVQDDGSDWRKREEDYQRRHQARLTPAPAPPRPRRAYEGYYTDNADTNASKCRLARDIASGQAAHLSGKPTDAYDREVAHNDIRNFCR